MLMNNKAKQKNIAIVLAVVLLCAGVLLAVILLQQGRGSGDPDSSSSVSGSDVSDGQKSGGLDVVDPEKHGVESAEPQVPFKPAEDRQDSDGNSAQSSQPSSADSQPDKSTPEKSDDANSNDNTTGSDPTASDSLKDQNDTGTAYGKFY